MAGHAGKCRVVRVTTERMLFCVAAGLKGVRQHQHQNNTRHTVNGAPLGYRRSAPTAEGRSRVPPPLSVK